MRAIGGSAGHRGIITVVIRANDTYGTLQASKLHHRGSRCCRARWLIGMYPLIESFQVGVNEELSARYSATTTYHPLADQPVPTGARI